MEVVRQLAKHISFLLHLVCHPIAVSSTDINHVWLHCSESIHCITLTSPQQDECHVVLEDYCEVLAKGSMLDEALLNMSFLLDIANNSGCYVLEMALSTSLFCFYSILLVSWVLGFNYVYFPYH